MRRPRCFCSHAWARIPTDARQDEQAAAELRLEAQLAEDHGGDAVDVHRDVARRLIAFSAASTARADRRVAAADRACGLRPWRPARTAARCADRSDGSDGRSRARSSRRRPCWRADDVGRPPATRSPSAPAVRVDLAVELHALLAGAAVDVVEHVDRGGHRAVDRQAAGHRHARDRDRRRVRPVVDARHQRGLEQVAPAPRVGSSPRSISQIMSGKRTRADQLLDRVAADRDLARMDVDDRRVPPGAAFGEQFFGRLRRHGRSQVAGCSGCGQVRGQVVIVSTSASSAGS